MHKFQPRVHLVLLDGRHVGPVNDLSKVRGQISLFPHPPSAGQPQDLGFPPNRLHCSHRVPELAGILKFRSNDDHDDGDDNGHNHRDSNLTDGFVRLQS